MSRQPRTSDERPPSVITTRYGVRTDTSRALVFMQDPLKPSIARGVPSDGSEGTAYTVSFTLADLSDSFVCLSTRAPGTSVNHLADFIPCPTVDICVRDANAAETLAASLELLAKRLKAAVKDDENGVVSYDARGPVVAPLDTHDSLQ